MQGKGGGGGDACMFSYMHGIMVPVGWLAAAWGHMVGSITGWALHLSSKFAYIFALMHARVHVPVVCKLLDLPTVHVTA